MGVFGYKLVTLAHSSTQGGVIVYCVGQEAVDVMIANKLMTVSL